MFGPMGSAPPSPFLTRIGNRVLPESFTAATRRRWRSSRDGKSPGAYAVDDEGVPAQDVTLVREGPAEVAADQPHAAEGLPASRTATGAAASRRPASSSCSRRGRRPRRAQGEIPGAAEGQDGRAFGYIVRALAAGGPSRRATPRT